MSGVGVTLEVRRLLGNILSNIVWSFLPNLHLASAYPRVMSVVVQELDNSKAWSETLGIGQLTWDKVTMARAAACVMETTFLSLLTDTDITQEVRKQKLSRQVTRLTEMGDKLGQSVQAEMPPRLVGEVQSTLMS